MPLNPDINKSLDVKFDTLSATIYQLTDKELAIGKSLHTAGNRFDKGEITREEYQTEAQRILDQARQEIDPLLEKAEQEMKAIEAKINSLPQPDENPVEAGIAAADRAAEAEIDKSENPTGARKWIKMARRHFLPITLTVLVSGMGELGYFIYKGYKNQGEKGTPAEIQKETKNTAPTPKIPTPEEIVLRKEADSLKAEIAQNRVQDSINHPEEFISAQEETPISNPTAENQDQTIDQTAIAREQMAQAMNHSRVESSPPLRDNASRKTPKATETEEIGLTNREIKEALQNDIARLKAQLAKHKIAAPTSANESKAETEGLTTEHSARLNKILNQAGMSSDEYARLINETDKNGEHWTVDKFLQKYSGLNGLISIGDTYADTRAATHRNNLAEIISRVLVDQKTKDFVKHMTLGELFMYLQSIGQ